MKYSFVYLTAIFIFFLFFQDPFSFLLLIILSWYSITQKIFIRFRKKQIKNYYEDIDSIYDRIIYKIRF